MSGSETVLSAVIERMCAVESDAPDTSTITTDRVAGPAPPRIVSTATKLAGLPKMKNRTEPPSGMGKNSLSPPLVTVHPGLPPVVEFVTVAPFVVLPVTFPDCHVGPELMNKPFVMLRQAMDFP
jgi:hypothetical protein